MSERPKTVWKKNEDSTSSRPGIPSTRKNGVNPNTLPPLKLLGGNSPGAGTTLPDGSEVHAFPNREGGVSMHHKARDEVHTPLSPRTTAIIMNSSPDVTRAVTFSQTQPPVMPGGWSSDEMSAQERVARALIANKHAPKE